MANEITINTTLECKKGQFSFPRVGKSAVKVTQNGFGGGAPGQVLVGAMGVDVDLSEIEVPGWLWMQNIDSHQAVRFGVNDGGFRRVGLMKPGEPAQFRLDPAAVLRLEIDPGTEDPGSTSAENAAKVQIYVLED